MSGNFGITVLEYLNTLSEERRGREGNVFDITVSKHLAPQMNCGPSFQVSLLHFQYFQSIQEQAEASFDIL